jgi:hypothetical protein
MRRLSPRSPRLLVSALGLALAITLVRFEHRRSRVAELWIVSLPAGFEMSVQRIDDTGSWAAFWFNDRGGNTLLYFKEGTQPGPRPTPVNDWGIAVAYADAGSCPQSRSAAERRDAPGFPGDRRSVATGCLARATPVGP